MKRKIINLVLIMVLTFLCFTVSAFAAQGEHYDNSDIACGGCYHSGCQYCDAYDKGYNDGILDGQKTGFTEGATYYEENILPGLIQGALDDYKNTEEYQQEFNAALVVALEQYYAEFYQALTEARSDAVEEYKNSQEFSNILDERYAAGEAAGLEVGLTEGANSSALVQYEMGYSDGKTEYINSPEYTNLLQQSANYGYEYGYQDGLQDGSNRESDDGLLVKSLVILSISLTVLLILFVVVTFIIKKVKRKKKK